MGSFAPLPLDGALGMTPSILDRKASHSDMSHSNPSGGEVFHSLLWSTGMTFRLLSSVEKIGCTLGLSEMSHPKSGLCWLSSTCPKETHHQNHVLKKLFEKSLIYFYVIPPWLVAVVNTCYYQQVYGLLMPYWGLLILSGSWYLK